jgi:hypothetical protein
MTAVEILWVLLGVEYKIADRKNFPIQPMLIGGRYDRKPHFRKKISISTLLNKKTTLFTLYDEDEKLC